MSTSKPCSQAKGSSTFGLEETNAQKALGSSRTALGAVVQTFSECTIAGLSIIQIIMWNINDRCTGPVTPYTEC